MGMIFFGAIMMSVAVGAKLTPFDGFIVFGAICMIVGVFKSLDE
jgi:hypothetical protein